MGQNIKTSKPWYKKTWVIIVGVLLILTIIGNFGKKGKTNNSESSRQIDMNNTPTEKVQEKKWTEVYSFTGNGMKKSPAFTLEGGEAKVVYKYKAPNGLGMGMFAVYVVDEGEDIMKSGGFPEVMTQAENEESESAIQKSSGRYYLDVNASGTWSVSVYEFK